MTLGYKIAENYYLDLTGFFGFMHWDGSDWITYSGGSAKWPENDTTYIGGNLSVKYEF